MRRMSGRWCLVALLLLVLPIRVMAQTRIVCVETAWCDIAAQIGGAAVTTQALLVTPGIDPHEITPSPSMARALATASVVVVNGGTYDDWALPLARADAYVLNVARLVGWTPGDNPHLFLDPVLAGTFADALTALLKRLDPAHAAQFDAGFARFEQTRHDVMAQLDQVAHALPRGRVAAVEPAGMALLRRAGMIMVDPGFAIAILKHSTPSPREVAELQTALITHSVDFLLLNPAIRSPQIDALTAIAQAHGVPLVAVGETLPPGQDWAAWLTGIISAIPHNIHGADGDVARR